jgi:hypothetical protein
MCLEIICSCEHPMKYSYEVIIYHSSYTDYNIQAWQDRRIETRCALCGNRIINVDEEIIKK